MKRKKGGLVMEKNSITKKQHYIPQVYLKGFQVEKGLIYQYKKEMKDNSDRKSVPIKSICQKKCFYEIQDQRGQYICPNHLEHYFGWFENHFNDYVSKLESKAFDPDNLKTRCFLDKEEKKFWITYISIQFLRLPGTLKIAEECAKEIFQEKANKVWTKNIARIACLPFWEEEDIGENWYGFYEKFVEPMMSMHIGIGADASGKLITSDNPVCIFSDRIISEEYKEIIFPISSKLCLYMVGGEEKKRCGKNFLFFINEKNREKICDRIKIKAKQYLYSGYELSDI